DRPAVAVACDMPHVTVEVLRRLVAAPGEAAVVAPRRGPDAPWEPLLARYDSPRVRPVLAQALARGERSFQALLGRLPVQALPPDPALERALEDWDAPDDLG
ncbi:MAG: NTP transferase domain-containing protein, partial [Myxococcota bacterium]